MIASRMKGIPILKRAQLLAQLMETQIGITVAGAHGKTTTTSMVSNLLIKAGMQPTTAIGGVISYNATLGAGKYFIAEVDESDGSFLYFSPSYSIITNVDFEHVDHYHNWNNILMTYQKFIRQTAKKGWVIICGDDVRLRKLASSRKQVIRYGFGKDNDVSASNIACHDFASEFDCTVRGELKGRLKLNVPGKHNILNALACVSLSTILNLDFDLMAQSLNDYQSVQRRFQIKGNVNNILVVDDYGHHPTEVEATLEAARLSNRRVVMVFQPHRYTRTKFLFDEFVKCLRLSDYLILTDIYAASEPPISGVTAEKLVESIKKDFKKPIFYLKKNEIMEHVCKAAKPGDVILFQGAGDVNQMIEPLLKRLQEIHKSSLQPTVS